MASKTSLRRACLGSAYAVLAVCLMLSLATCDLFKVGLGEKVDISVPTLEITSPTNGSYITGVVHLKGTASDDTGVAAVSVAVSFPASSGLSAKNYTAAFSDGQWSLDFDSAALAPGIEVNANVLVTATDLASKTSEQKIIIYVDNNPPTVKLTSPTADDLANAAYYVNGSLRFRGAADPDVANLYLDVGGMPFSPSNGNNASFSIQVDTDAFSDGDVPFKLWAVDNAGNHSVESVGTLHILQSSDTPKLSFKGADNADIVDLSSTSKSLGTNRNNFKRGDTINGTISDDDGLDFSSLKLTLTNSADPLDTRTFSQGAALAENKISIKTLGTNTDPDYPTAVTSASFSFTIPTGMAQGIYYLSYSLSDSAAAKLPKQGDTPWPVSTIQDSGIYFVIDDGQPTTTITSPSPGAFVQSLQAAGLAQEGLGIKAVEYQIDGITEGAWTRLTNAANDTPFSWSFSQGGFSEGGHKLYARPISKGNSTGQAVSVDFTIDVTPPSVQILSAAPSSTSSSAQVTAFAAVSDASVDGGIRSTVNGVTRIKGYASDTAALKKVSWVVTRKSDGGVVETGTIASAKMASWNFDLDTTSGTYADGARYVVTVSAEDQAGNSSLARLTIDVSQASDNPTLSLTGWKTVSDLAHAKENLLVSDPKVSAVVYDDDWVDDSSVYILFNKAPGDAGATWKAVPSTSQADGSAALVYGFSADGASGTALPEGPNYFYLRASDFNGADGRKSGKATVTTTIGPIYFVIDTIQPTISFTQTGGLYVSSSQALSGTVSSGNALDPSAPLSFTPEGGSTTVLTASDLAPGPSSMGSHTWNYTLDVSHLSDGPVSITATARDEYGLPGSASFVVTVDKTPPVVTVSNAATAFSDISGYLLTGTAKDVTSGLQQMTAVVKSGATDVSSSTVFTLSSVTSNPNTMGNWSLDVSGLASGTYTVDLKATDKAGNIYQVTTFPIIVDKDLPVATVDNAGGQAVDGAVYNAASVMPASWSGQATDLYFASGKVSFDGTKIVDLASSGSWSFLIDWNHVSEGKHTLKVEVTDQGGHNAVTTATFTKDTLAPVLTVVKPALSSWIQGASSVISGTADDRTAGTGVADIYYKVDTVLADHSSDDVATISSSWSHLDGAVSWSDTIDLASLGEGAKKLWVCAKDAAGNWSAPLFQAFGIDQNRPEISETEINTDSRVNRTASFDIAGTVSDSNPDGAPTLTLSIDGGTAQPVPLTAGAYRVTITVDTATHTTDGDHTYVLTVTDVSGKTNTPQMKRLVHIDTSAPAVTLGNLAADGSTVILDTSLMKVMGSITDATAIASATSTIEYSPDYGSTWEPVESAASLGSPSGLAWSFSKSLAGAAFSADGLYRISVTASDSLGNTASSVALKFYLDRKDPDVSLVALTKTALKKAFTATGTAFSANITGVSWSLDSDTAKPLVGPFAPGVSNGISIPLTQADVDGLLEGPHKLEVQATSLGGRIGRYTLAFTVDRSAPSVSFTNISAAGDSVMTESSPRIIGAASDATAVALVERKIERYTGPTTLVLISDFTAMGSASGTNYTWTADLSNATTYPDGKYQITIRTTDDTDEPNSATGSPVVFYIDRAVPTVSITSPASGAAYSQGFTIEGTADDANLTSVSAKLDGVTDLSVSGSAAWSIALTTTQVQGFSEGPHSVSVTAKDVAGNSSIAQVLSFRTDHTAPGLSWFNISGSGGTVVQDSAPKISGTLTDESGIASATATLERYNYSTGLWSVDSIWDAKSLGVTGSPTIFAWSVDISSSTTYPDGKYRLKIAASDITTPANSLLPGDGVEFMLSRSNPSVAISVPALGSFQNAGFTIAGTAFDFNAITDIKAKFGSGSVDFASGTTSALPAMQVAVTTGVPGIFTTSLPNGLSVGDTVYLYGSPMPSATINGVATVLQSNAAYKVDSVAGNAFTLQDGLGHSITVNSSTAGSMLAASTSMSFVPAPQAVTVSSGDPSISIAAAFVPAVGQVVYFQGGPLPTGLSGCTPYYVVSVAGTSFQVSTTSGGASVTPTSTGSGVLMAPAASWLIPSMSAASGDGSQTVFIQAHSANSQKTSVTSRDFTLDSTKPLITITSPSSGTRSVGSLTIIGATSDPGSLPSGITGTIQYKIGCGTDPDNPAGWTNASVTGGAYSWSISLGLMSAYANETYATKCDASGNSATTGNLWKLPIYFQAVDKAGNVQTEKNYWLILDPDGNIPVVTITQPSLNAQTYGGEQRITGMATQPVWIHDVEVAIDPSGGASFPEAVPATISGSTVNATGHGLANGRSVYFSATASLPKVAGVNVSASIPYFVVNATTDTFQVAARPDGAALTFSDYGSGVMVGVWGPATLLSTGNSVMWYHDINLGNYLPQGGATSQTISVQARAWNSPAAGGATRGSLSGTLLTPLTMKFDSTFPKIQGMKVSPTVSYSDVSAKSYYSQISVGGQIYILGYVDSSKGIKKIEKVETSTGSGATSLYDTSGGSFGATSTVTPPASIPAGSFPNGGSYQLIITSLGSTNWNDIGFVGTPTVGSVFKPNGIGSGSGTAIPSDSSGNFSYYFAIPVDTSIGFPNSSGVYSFDIRATDMTTPSQVSSQSIALDADNYYPTATFLSAASVVGTQYQLQGTATDVGSGSGTISSFKRVVVYLTRSGNVINMLDGSTSAIGSIVAKDGGTGTIGSFDYPSSSGSGVMASVDDLLENNSLPSGTGTDRNGDGFYEYLGMTGTTYNWDVQIDSTKIPDGPAVVHYVAFDSVGNATHYQTSVFVRNNAPSITAVTLGTDLNGDGTVGDIASETTTYGPTSFATTGFLARNNKLSFSFTTAGGNGQRYYSVKYPNASGAELVTLKSAGSFIPGRLYRIAVAGASPAFTSIGAANNSADTIFVASGAGSGTGSAYELSASGESTAIVAGRCYYISAAITSGEATTFGASATTVGTRFTAATLGTLSGSGRAIQVDTLPSSSGSLDIYTFPGAANLAESSSANDRIFVLRVYDSTVGTTPGVDSLEASATVALAIKNVDTTAPSITMRSLYWNSVSDNSLYQNSLSNGHLDLGSLTGATGNLADADARVSGKVRFEGTVSDDQRIQYIRMKVASSGGGFDFAGGSSYGAWFTVAAWDPATKKLVSVSDGITNCLSTRGWLFTLSGESISESGHSASWTLVWDSAKIKNGADTNLSVQVQVQDFRNPGTNVANTLNHAEDSQQIDVVPYIYDISRLSLFGGRLADNALNPGKGGFYPLLQGATGITVTGFNLLSSATQDASNKILVGLTALDITGGNYVTRDSLTVTIPPTLTTSGGGTNADLVVTTNGIASINNVNDANGYNTANSANGDSTADNKDNRQVYIDEQAPTIAVAAFGLKYPVQDYDDGTNGNKETMAVADYTENVPYSGSDMKKRDTWLGHVEYAADSVFGDSQPNLSGLVTFKGKAMDNQRILKITAKINYFDPDGAGSTYSAGAEFPIYTYAGGAQSGTGWYAAIDGGAGKDYRFTDATRVNKGHVLNWNFTIDTSLITSASQKNVVVTFKAYDNNNTPLTGSSAMTVDIVPYVTKISTALSGAYSSNTSVVNRSALGYYPVRENESVVLSGFNFGGASTSIALNGTALTPAVPSISVSTISGSTITASAPHGLTAGQTVYFGGTTLPSTAAGVLLAATPYYVSSTNLTSTKFEVSTLPGSASLVFTATGSAVTVKSPASSLSVPIGSTATSGALSVSVNAVNAVNNNRTNTRAWNQEANGLNNDLLTDDRKLVVWKFTTVVSDPTVRYPSMRIVDSDTAAKQFIGWSYDQSENYFFMTRSDTHLNAQFQSNPTRYYDTTFAFDEQGDTFGEGNSGDITAGGGTISDWSSACFFSNLPGSGALTYSGGYNGGTYATRFASLSSDGTVANTNSNRIQNPDMVAALAAPGSAIGAGNKATIYLSYYDAVLNSVQLRVGTVGPITTIAGAIAEKGTHDSAPWDTAGVITIAGPGSATAKAGQYSAIALNPVDRSTLVAVWYESSTRKLWYSYNTQPSLAGQASQWQSHAIALDTNFAGGHCDVTVDAGGGVHIAYFRSSTGDLCYAKLASYSDTSPTIVTVDSYLSVGEYLRIGALFDGSNYVPSISYYSGTFASTTASVKVAYQKDFTSLQDGATNDRFTGAWEVMTLPCANNPKPFKVSIGYKDFGSGTRSTVLGYATDATLEYAYSK